MAPKRKTETFKSNIPWENVGSTTLRVVCRDVAGPSTTIALRTKETMISFLWDLEQYGLEVAVETLLQQSPEPSKSAAPATPTNTRTRTTSLKRKKPEPEPTAEESDEEEATEGDNALPYNTRHKGQKRVRVTAPPLPKMSSVRRRSTASRTVKKDVEPDDSEDATGETSVTPVKRGRGRPRKSAPTAAPAKADAASGSAVKRGRGRPRKSAASPPKKAGKQVFDGIELKRAKTRETTGDVDADGEPDDEALAVPNGETSSLGSSNKENNPELAFTAPEETLAAEAVSAQMSLVDAINLSNNPA